MEFAYCHLNEKFVSLSKPPAAPFLQVAAAIVKYRGKYVIGDEAVELSEKDPSLNLHWVVELPFATPSLTKASRRELFTKFFVLLRLIDGVQETTEGCQYWIYCMPYFHTDNAFRGSMETLKVREVGPQRMMRIFITEEELAALSTLPNHSSEAGRIVVNIHMDRTNICSPVPVCDSDRGVCLQVGADTVFNYFVKLLCAKGYDFTSPAKQDLCREKLFKYCFVALDYEEERLKLKKNGGLLHRVQVDEDTIVDLGEECFLAPEVLFNPSLIGIDTPGLHQGLFNILQDPYFRHLLHQPTQSLQLVLVGELSNLTLDISQRLKLEVSTVVPISKVSQVDVSSV
eukprot:CAMPEP_0184067578 /NCGR_PEP_ID=MMETSP0957-20130417/20820_1 /TAXON_ID=627963 /ORGANISM="Aplanochytrium sp, Strain PBS07" /LENGTH=342 /DNA_ID=CAMNT_0026366029 /DNA_START=129 /DNA_END=1154 /DNA_ORIENTATION=+